MTAYLKIENPGIAPEESFTLLGASTKKDGNGNVIGQFGTGSKQSVALLLRKKLSPIVFAGQLKLEFYTEPTTVNDGIRESIFEQVCVQFGGKDQNGKTRNSKKDLGFVVDHGITDWKETDLAMREFISNAIDRSIQQGEYNFLFNCVEQGIRDKKEIEPKLIEYRKTAKDFNNVVIEVVNENQVRAKNGFTRVFVPLNDEVLNFYNNLGKWFLHFSEPELLNKTLLPKRSRSLTNRQSAVIYRRGVRVREFMTSETASLFDYNLELTLDESRKVDDYYVQHYASVALANSEVEEIGQLWQSFLDGKKYWEHSFQSYGLGSSDHKKEVQEKWQKAFEMIAGNNAVISTAEGAERAQKKGYKIVVAPQEIVEVAQRYGVNTPAKVLTKNELDGREIFEATEDVLTVAKMIWSIIAKHNLTNGKQFPDVKTFSKINDGGTTIFGYYLDNVIYVNRNISVGISHELKKTVLEELAHYITGEFDFTRGFQDYAFNLASHLMIG